MSLLHPGAGGGTGDLVTNETPFEALLLSIWALGANHLNAEPPMIELRGQEPVCRATDGREYQPEAWYSVRLVPGAHLKATAIVIRRSTSSRSQGCL